MTAQEAVRMWSRHDANIHSEDLRKKKATIREVYQIICDPGDGPKEVTQAESLPQIGSLYSGTYIPCKRRIPKQVSPIFWTCDVVYEGEFGPGGAEDSPLNDPPEKSWSKIESDATIDEDIDNKAIATANGEPMEGLTMKISDLVLTVKRNYAGINLPVTLQYLHSVNSDTFAGFAPGVAKLTQFAGREVLAEGGFTYWEVTAGITFRVPWRTTPERAWWIRARHEGFYVKREDDGKIIRAVDPGNKEPVTRPVQLQEDGTAFEDQTEAFFKEFQVYKPLPYNALGLL